MPRTSLQGRPTPDPRMASMPEPAGIAAPIRGRRVRVGIVGGGDVAHRWYLPALASIAEQVEVVAVCDRDAGVSQRAVGAVRAWSPDASPFTDLEVMLAEADLDAVYNLTPAPLHAEVTLASLVAGVHVFSEKPLAGSVAAADELIEALITTSQAEQLAAMETGN